MNNLWITKIIKINVDKYVYNYENAKKPLFFSIFA